MTPLERARNQTAVIRADLEKAVEIEHREFKLEQWRKGYFTYETDDSIPRWFFPLTSKMLEKWNLAGHGPIKKEAWVDIREMHDFLWCRDIGEFTPARRRWIREKRLQRLDNQVFEIEHLIKGLSRVVSGQGPGANWKISDAWKKIYLSEFPDGFNELKETIQMFKTTGDLRTAMIKLFGDVESGAVTASVARTKVQVAKTIVDTLKVEIAAANLGKQFGTVNFDQIENSGIRRVA